MDILLHNFNVIYQAIDINEEEDYSVFMQEPGSTFIPSSNSNIVEEELAAISGIVAIRQHLKTIC